MGVNVTVMVQDAPGARLAPVEQAFTPAATPMPEAWKSPFAEIPPTRATALPVFESLAMSVVLRPTRRDAKVSACGVRETLAGVLSPSSETNSSESELSD